ncbi:hypothetical protein [Nocardiopsis algeriensis]|uniref:CAAX prenyl protease-like protein n=1 Tax=Nocardiopsis algeriensis TaxID=1478215 RepID=A0A841IP64_9ACTN|nr:hypothetical protein [Nocardiopsis algeriensis]MBB6119872.1 hypothetical protein [Nocardiopsis algeriensis]
MYFHPPTLEPGPAALTVAAAALLLTLSEPLLAGALRKRARGAPGPNAAGTGPALWFSAAELGAVVLFAATAVRVSPADLGLNLPDLDGHTSRDLVPDGAGPLAPVVVALVLLATAAYAGLLLRERRREPRREEAAPGAAPMGEHEVGAAIAVFLCGGLATTVLQYALLYPVLALYGGPVAAVLGLAVLAGWQMWGSGPGMMAGHSLYTLLMALCYTLLFPGSLLVPAAAWCLLSYGAAGMLRRAARAPNPQGRVPLEVIMLDADGNPVRRPGE